VVTLQPDPTRGNLASGVYNADLLLSSGSLASTSISSQLTLTPPTLSATAAAITLGGPKGRDLTSAQSLSVSLNTGSNSWPFTLTGLPPWANSTNRSGNVGGQGTTISVSPVGFNIVPGSKSATATLTASVNGDRAVLPITVNVNADQRRLLVSEWGIGLASTPTGEVLTRKLTVRDNFEGTLAWSASSNAGWLSVSPSGTTGGSNNLSLTADPTSLPADTVSYADVTISTATTGVTAATVRVGLWKSASGLAAITKLPQAYSNVVADKIRPYVYVNNGGASIDVYNAYTAQKVVRTIGSLGGALGAMTIAPDGSLLYALDTANKTLVLLDLNTLAKAGTWALDNATGPASTLVAVKPNGVDMVLLDDFTGYAAGRSLGNTGVIGAVASADGQKLFSLGSRWAIDYSEMSGGTVFGSQIGMLDSRSGGNPQDIAVNKEGTRAYAASGGGTAGVGYRCGVIDATDGSFIGALPGGDAYPNNVEVTSDGRPICGISGWYSTYDIWVHSADGALLQGYKFAGYAKELKPRQMVVTPDGFVVVGLTDDPLIAFVPIGGP